MKKCVSILVGVLAVIAAAAAVLVALDRFRKQTDEDPNVKTAPAAGANIVDLGAETLPIAG